MYAHFAWARIENEPTLTRLTVLKIVPTKDISKESPSSSSVIGIDHRVNCGHHRQILPWAESSQSRHEVARASFLTGASSFASLTTRETPTIVIIHHDGSLLIPTQVQT